MKKTGRNVRLSQKAFEELTKVENSIRENVGLETPLKSELMRKIEPEICLGLKRIKNDFVKKNKIPKERGAWYEENIK